MAHEEWDAWTRIDRSANVTLGAALIQDIERLYVSKKKKELRKRTRGPRFIYTHSNPRGKNEEILKASYMGYRAYGRGHNGYKICTRRIYWNRQMYRVRQSPKKFNAVWTKWRKDGGGHHRLIRLDWCKREVNQGKPKQLDPFPSQGIIHR